MKKTIAIIVTIASVILLATIGVGAYVILKSDKPDKNVVTTYQDENCKRIGEFTAKTAATVLGSKENVCYSPISLYALLCLASEVTTDSTSKEILDAFGYDELKDMENNHKYIFKELEADTAAITFKNSNSLWLNDSFANDGAKELINSFAERFPIESHLGDYTAEDANLWISEKTEGLVEDNIVKENKFSIINVAYFESKWADAFEYYKKDDFTLENGKKVQADYIKNEGERIYISGDDYIAIKEKYNDKQGDANMIFILPDKGKEINDLLNKKTINEILATSENIIDKADVTIKIPKFKYESCLKTDKMTEAVEKIGITNFDSASVWEKLIKKNAIEDVEIIQQCSIAVDEKKTVATGVTKVEMLTTGIEDEEELIKLDITFDRPFMYIVVRNDIPLFIGTVYNPTEG